MKLPVVSGQQAIEAFGRVGYQADRQRGSHVVLRHANPPHRRLSITFHREIAKGTLRALIRESGLTVDEFIRLL
jgi:predicted RNA binding protein YcfA (HicA-like mRNA interferase family)